MCIIMYHKAGQIIPDEYLDNSALNHPDGWGIMYVNSKGQLQTLRGLKGEDCAIAYQSVLHQNPKAPIAVHYRKITDGSAVIENCHPFRIDDHHAFMHNGTIYPCKPSANDKRDMSDTRIFNDLIMKDMPEGWFGNVAIGLMLNDFILRSKLLFMRSNGDVWIIGEDKGDQENRACWDNGVWFSNQSYKSKKVYVHDVGTQNWQGRHGRHETYVRPAGGEWDEDGLGMKWNAAFRCVEAWDKTDFRWRRYLCREGRFENHPYTCHGHKPAEHKPYAKELADLKAKQKEREEQQHPLVLLPGGRTNEAKRYDMHARCDYCTVLYNMADLEFLESDNKKSKLMLCADCMAFFKEMEQTRNQHDLQ